MGSYCSVENDISDADEVWMKFSACGSQINWNTSAGFTQISRGSSHKSRKEGLSLALQINIIVFKNGRKEKYKGHMMTYTGGTDKSTSHYYASRVPISKIE